MRSAQFPRKLGVFYLLSENVERNGEYQTPVFTGRFSATRVLPAYDLVVAKDGSKLAESKASGKSFGGGRAYFHAEGLTTKLIAEQLSQIAGRVVVDRTGLDGRYDLKLKWTPDDAVATADSSPELFTAIEEQLGLQLKAAKEPVPVLVVDHIEPPSPN